MPSLLNIKIFGKKKKEIIQIEKENKELKEKVQNLEKQIKSLRCLIRDDYNDIPPPF